LPIPRVEESLMSTQSDVQSIRETVRQRYAGAATGASCGSDANSSCCGGGVSTQDKDGNEVFGAALYEGDEASAPGIELSLGCGNPTAVADLHEGETVLDLGSGAGGDVLLSAKRVGAAGKAIGLDMTDEM